MANPIATNIKNMTQLGLEKAKEGATQVADNNKENAQVYQVADNFAETKNKILHWPDNLREDGREVIRFSIRKRSDLDNIPGSIYLHQAPGFSLADTAQYSGDAFGVKGRASLEAVDMATETVGAINSATGSNFSALDFAKGIGKNIKDTVVEDGLDVGSALVGQMGTIGKALQAKQGKILSPFSNLTYSGPAMRGFTFQYKMVAETPDESEMIKDIENTFRKYLYPKEAVDGFVLEYPPYFMIQFLRTQITDEGEFKLVENEYLPFLKLSYLQSMSATYNSSSNAFHEKGQPIELDLSLTFAEASMQTRNTLYEEGDDSAQYLEKRDRRGITSMFNGAKKPKKGGGGGGGFRPGGAR